MNLQDWLSLNFNQRFDVNLRVLWSIMWCISYWYLWFWHNKEVHNGDYSRPQFPHKIIRRYANKVGRASDQNALNHMQMGSIEVSWIPLREGWVKLNTDGAANGETKIAGCGGLLRDVDGRWICGFTEPLGSCFTFITEW